MVMHLRDYGRISSSRIRALITAERKAEATKLSFFDRFKDCFRSANNKKRTKINALYDKLHNGIHLTVGKSNIDRIFIFNQISLLADDGRQHLFKTDVIGAGPLGTRKVLRFSIADEVLLELNSYSSDEYLIERLKNQPGTSIDELLKLNDIIGTSLMNPSTKIKTEFENTMAKFFLSRTAKDPGGYTIKRNYQNHLLTTEMIGLYDKQIDDALTEATDVSDFLERVPENYANCSTQCIYMGANLSKQGFDVSIHDIKFDGADHTFAMVRASDGVYLCDPWSGVCDYVGSNEEIKNIHKLSQNIQDRVLKLLSIPTSLESSRLFWDGDGDTIEGRLGFSR